MKKSFFIMLAFIMISFSLFAQSNITWISFALKGGYGTGVLFHNESFLDDNVNYNLWSPSYTVGGRFGFIFGESNFSVSLEALSTDLKPSFSITDINGNSSLHNADIKEYNFALIIKGASFSGLYFELGPQFSLINSAKFDDDDISSSILNSYTSGIIGLGFMPLIGDKLEISLGLRAMVSLGSIIGDSGYNFYSLSPNANMYTTNSTIAVGFFPVFEINYIFAYMGRASCGAFRILLNK